MRDKPNYTALDIEKRNALREGRATWRNAAEQIATLLRLVASGDAKADEAAQKADDLLAAARADTKRGKNGQ